MSTYYPSNEPPDDDGWSQMRGVADRRERTRSGAATLDAKESRSDSESYKWNGRRARSRASGSESSARDFESRKSEAESHYFKRAAKKEADSDRRSSFSLTILSAVILFSLCAYTCGNSPQMFVMSTGLCAVLLIVFNEALENLIQRLSYGVADVARLTKRSRISSPLNLALLALGVVFPAIVLIVAMAAHGSFWGSSFDKHPIEWLIYTTLLVSVPAANLTILLSSLSDKLRDPRVLCTACGVALGVSFAVTFLLEFIYRDFSLGQALFVFVIGAGAILTTCLLYARLARRSAVHSDPKCKTLAGFGLILSLLAIGAMEARPAAIRLAEKLALASDAQSRRTGIKILDTLGAAPDILEEFKYWHPNAATKSPFSYPPQSPQLQGVTGSYGDAYVDYNAPNRWDAVFSKPVMSLSLCKVFEEETASIYYRLTGLTATGTLGIGPIESVPEYDHNIGVKIPGLEIARSTIAGNLNSHTLSSYMDWTYELSNTNSTAQEGKVKLQLPKNAVVSRVTTWINGKPEEAAFAPTANAAGAYRWVVHQHRDPVLVTQTGENVVLIECSPVPAHGTMQVRIGITAPVLPEGQRAAKMELPVVLDSNFDANRTACKLQVATDSIASAEVEGKVEKLNSTHGVIACDTKLDGTMNLHVVRDADSTPVVAVDTRSGRKSVTVTRILSSQAKRPSRIVIVLDGSSSVAPYRKTIADALANLPADYPTTYMFASDELPMVSTDSKEIPKLIESAPFQGGQLNERFLQKAFKDAGDEGSVFWIHGSQFTMDPEVAIASIGTSGHKDQHLYHISVDHGISSIIGGLKYCDLKTESIEHTGSLAKDISLFIKNTLAKTSDFTVIRDHAESVPQGYNIIPSGIESTQLATLWAHDELERLIANGNEQGAESLGELYRIVSKVTSAVVLERKSDYEKFNMVQPDSQNFSKNAGLRSTQLATLADQAKINATPQMVALDSSNAGSQSQQYNSGQGPFLQGATNGTIGPQGDDATAVMGVNTAGTVRVNNMVTIEAVLSIVANALEILGLSWGVPNIILGVMRFGVVRDAAVRIGVGIGSVTFGLVTPGLVNWLVNTARDANLFS